MQALFIIAGFVIGACVGSFIGCAIYRVPRGISLIHGRSHCPSCGKTLGITELVPVASYIYQGGICRSCHAPLSRAYLLAEIACGVIGALVGYFISI